MTLLGPGVIAAMTPNMINETNSSGSMSNSCSVYSEAHPATWILARTIDDSQARVKFVEVDMTAANMTSASGGVKRGSAVHHNFEARFRCRHG